jgi:hypothetical protein
VDSPLAAALAGRSNSARAAEQSPQLPAGSATALPNAYQVITDSDVSVLYQAGDAGAVGALAPNVNFRWQLAGNAQAYPDRSPPVRLLIPHRVGGCGWESRRGER